VGRANDHGQRAGRRPEMGGSTRGRKAIRCMAAALLLQHYLDAKPIGD